MTLTNTSEVIYGSFKYKIEEVVQFKGAPHHTFLVIEQHIQICSGGQQIKYLVRAFKKESFGGISDKYTLFNEIELEAVEKEEKEEVVGKEDVHSHIAGGPSNR